MSFVLTLTFIICLFVSLLIVWDDFRTREVRAIWFGLLFFSVMLKAFLIIGMEVLLSAALNLSICILQLSALWFYFQGIRKKPLFDVGLGWGDVAMLAVLTPAFSPVNFLVFNLLSYVVAILYWALAKPGNRFIPLAGIQALMFSVLQLVIVASKKHYLTFNDTFWLNLIARYV